MRAAKSRSSVQAEKQTAEEYNIKICIEIVEQSRAEQVIREKQQPKPHWKKKSGGIFYSSCDASGGGRT